MGTESHLNRSMLLRSRERDVKLNNPLMGTERIENIVNKYDTDYIKLN